MSKPEKDIKDRLAQKLKSTKSPAAKKLIQQKIDSLNKDNTVLK